MAGLSLARVLAPLALVAFCLALYLVVTGSSRDPVSANGTRTEERRATTSQSSRARGARTRRQPRTYVVRSGDTPSAIAEKTDVPLSQLLELNPELDPQSLPLGARIRLRR